MRVHLFAKIDSGPEAYREVDITYYGVAPSLPFDPRGTFLSMYSLGGLLDLKNKKYVVSLYSIQVGLSSTLLLLLVLPWSICPQGTDSNWSAWGPCIFCLKFVQVQTLQERVPGPSLSQ